MGRKILVNVSEDEFSRTRQSMEMKHPQCSIVFFAESELIGYLKDIEDKKKPY